MKGYAGKVLHVDLTSGTFEVEKPPDSFYRKYIGGSLIGTYYVMNRMKKGTDALAPENVIVFSVGPLAGSTISGSARHAVTSKSPLTDGIIASEGGGYFAPQMKRAGFDAIVITGRAEKPVYLWIHDGEFEIRDAKNIWGKTTKDAQAIIREELNDSKAVVAQTGVAGETLCKYANVVNELAHFNGRGGLGAVMGSKNLRAIAARGTMKPDFHDNDAMQAFAAEGVKTIKDRLMGFKTTGTITCVDENIALGGLPTRNWSAGNYEHEDSLRPTAWNEEIIKPGTCYACFQSCKRHVDGSKTDKVDPAFGGPEYETLAMVGPNLGIDDKVAICKINEICAKYAFDTISFGGTAGFLMECYERGLITKEDTGGLELNFGNADAAIQLAELTGRGEGFGKLAAKGSARAAVEIGKGSDAYLITCKKKEMPAHMPQSKAALGLAYALVPFGADHVSSEMDPALSADPLPYQLAGFGFDQSVDPDQLNPEKAKFFWKTLVAYSMMDTVCVCVLTFGFWAAYDLERMVQAVNAATGMRMTLYEMMQVGERRVQMMRAFNAREGFTKDDDDLPKKMFTPLKGGVKDGAVVDKAAFDEAKRLYYAYASCNDENDGPTAERLALLNLEWVADWLKAG